MGKPSDRYRTIVADPPWAYEDGFWTTSHNARTGAKFNAKRKALPYARSCSSGQQTAT